jgi:hypothetical protein
VLLLLTDTITAQKITTPFSLEKAAEIAEIQTSKMSDILDLNADQRIRVYEINYKSAEKILKKSSEGLSETEYTNQLKDIRKIQKQEIAELLNPKQKAKWEDINKTYEQRKAKERKNESSQ